MPDVGLDLLQQFVAALDGPVAGNKDVNGDEALRAGLAGAEGMELHTASLVGMENLAHGFQVV